MKPIKITQKPHEILQDPLLNKGSAFTEKERNSLGLHGFLPCQISDPKEQIERLYKNFAKKRTALGKYVFLTDLLNRNEILFYLFAEKNIKEIMPIIYTPTVGEASQQYSMLYKERRGLYLSYPLQDKLEEIIANLPNQAIDVVVVTDGERILGLGDQGIGGMAIPIGKLSLYTLFGGIHPARTLPILLDVGTNNQELLESPLYLGWRHKRISGEEYYEFISHFIQALKKRYPNLLLQWEDFGKENARPLLDRYRKKILSFNDDIQGTAAIVLGGFYAACRKAKVKITDQKIVILGGGSAGIGIADVLCQALIHEGLSEKEAYASLYIIDIEGLLHTKLHKISAAQKPYARPYQELKDWKLSGVEQISLLDTVKNAHPTALIGVSAQGGAFSEEVVKEMALHVKRPIIFPLSNPTSKAEAFPEELLQWTEGEAIIATGSPFPPVLFKGKTFVIGQCNNAYIFPGVGLGALAVKAVMITDGMFWEAAKTLALLSPVSADDAASLFPDLADLRKISIQIALAVAMHAVQEGVAPKKTRGEIEQTLQEIVWKPHYDLFERG